jgi:hypothetical protein
MTTVRIEGNGLKVFGNLAEVVGRGMRKEVPAVLNKVAKQHSTTDIKKNVRTVFNVKASVIPRDTKMLKATSGRMVATVLIPKGKNISLKHFGASQNKKGVAIKIRRQGRSKTIPGAFGPKIAKLNKHVFKRKTKKRKPIRKLVGPSLFNMYNRYVEPLQLSRDQISKRLSTEANRKIKFLLRKVKNATT